MTRPDAPPVDFDAAERPVDLDVDLIIERGQRRKRVMPALAAGAVVLVLVVGSVVGVGLSRSGGGRRTLGSGSTATRIVHFTPFTSAGILKPGVRTTKVENGTCVHHKDDERADMFDCTVASEDGSDEDGPCIYGKHTAGLFCPYSFQPITGIEVVPEATFVPPTGPLPSTSSNLLALTMSNGAVCFPFSVHGAAIQGDHVTYICQHGKTQKPTNFPVLYGAVNKTTSTWTALYRAKIRGSKTLQRLTITTAWY
jgi:hypothetical protein